MTLTSAFFGSVRIVTSAALVEVDQRGDLPSRRPTNQDQANLSESWSFQLP